MKFIYLPLLVFSLVAEVHALPLPRIVREELKAANIPQSGIALEVREIGRMHRSSASMHIDR